MNTIVFVRRFLADYARNPVNLLMLVLVPAVFVVAAAGYLVDAAKLLSDAPAEASSVATATAGWAAAFLAGIAMYFQVSAARDADRGLVVAGLPARRLVAARLAAGLALALLVSVVALVALQVRTGIDQPARVIVGTAMFAVIYLGIGATVGALVRNPVNGTVLILFVWILDIFFVPSMGVGTKPWTRALPTHFVTLWMVQRPSGHGGRLGDLGIAGAWTLGAFALAFTVVVAAARISHRRHWWRARPGSTRDQLAAATRMGWRDWRRNPVLWLLLAAVPAVFILLAEATTPHRPIAIAATENGVRAPHLVDLFDVHAGLMAPIAIAAMATGVSLAVTATMFTPRQWGWYIAANTLLAATYALLGMLIAPIFGRVGGVFIAFLVPFLDIGMGQSPMLRGEPAGWARYAPGYGGYRVLIDATLTGDFDQTRALLIALGWLAALAAAATILFRRTTRPATR